jgi:hypothetical protein
MVAPTKMASLMSVETIRQHFAARLAAAELLERPFPHLVVTDALPADVYEQVLERNPFTNDPGTRYGDPRWTRQLRFPTEFQHRFQHDLHPRERTLQLQPWADIGDAFSDTGFIGRLLADRYPAYFSLRFGDIDAIERGDAAGFWARLHTRTFLQRHEPGYRLDAHTDVPARVATCIFSFPPGPGFEAAGTQLLEPLDPSVRCSGNAHYPLDGFRVVATAPYAPNTCFVFFKTRHSWHAVAPDAAEVPGGRFGMQVQLYEPDSGAVTDLSAPDLVRNGQFTRRRFRRTNR